MTKIIVFPGQGSQKKGMGHDLFPQFPEQVKLAESVLGYDVVHLCLQNPEQKLNNTEFTQPALFTVNALSYDHWLNEANRPPDIFAGHSLGEYNALLAAGVFTFEEGLRLVQQRGKLMAAAKEGGMLAVIGPTHTELERILDSQGFTSIDLANINTPEQIVVAGPPDQLRQAMAVLKTAGARAVPLNVSASFHSRYMAPAADAFARIIDKVSLRPPKLPVMANVTARPYPDQPPTIAALMARQIRESVRWYETISWLAALPNADFEEIGPGQVLTKMNRSILTKPILFNELPSLNPPETENGRPSATQKKTGEQTDSLPDSTSTVVSSGMRLKPAKPGLVFLYSGHGSQYYRMGESLYHRHPFFRKTMDLCSEIAAPILGFSITERLYQGPPASVPLIELPLSNAANFSLGFALTRVLAKRDICADAVLGYGIGEFLAATVAGGLTLQDWLILAIRHGQLTQVRTPKGKMMAVFAEPKLLDQAAVQFEGCFLAGHHFKSHMIVCGEETAMDRARHFLKSRDITCQILPVDRALHTPALEAVKPAFISEARKLKRASLSLPLFSPSARRWLDAIDADHLFLAMRETVDFRGAIQTLAPLTRAFIDLGPSGTLAAFIGYELGTRERTFSAINRFGRGMHTLEMLCDTLQT